MAKFSEQKKEEARQMLNHIGALTNEKILMEPRELVWKLAHLDIPQEQVDFYITGQYQVAKSLGKHRWIEYLRREATVVYDDRWMDQNIPLTQTSRHSKRKTDWKVKSFSTPVVSGHYSGMCQDVRQKMGMDLPVRRETICQGIPNSGVSVNQLPSAVGNAGLSTLVETQSFTKVDKPDASTTTNYDTDKTPLVEPSSFTKDTKDTVSMDTTNFVVQISVDSSEYESFLNDQIDVPVHSRKRKLDRTVSTCKNINAPDSSLVNRTTTFHQVHPKFSESVTDLRVTIPSEKDDSISASKKRKAQKCPFPECEHTNSRLKRHIQRQHLPSWFSDETDRENDLPRLRALRSLCHAISDNEDFQSLVRIVNFPGSIPETSHINKSLASCMTNMCEFAGWIIPETFTLHPVNSPAVLLHHRCLCILLLKLTPNQREQFALTGAVQSQRIQPCMPEIDQSSRVASIQSSEEKSKWTQEKWPAFDSHFHLDRTCAKIWGSAIGKTPEDLIAYGNIVGSPDVPVVVCGGVIVFSEPSNYHYLPRESGVWKIAVGVHPKHISELTDDRFHQLQDLMKLPMVSALGEVGLDRSVPVTEWRFQETVLTKVLRCASPAKCLVLHLRGNSLDRYSMDVSARCLRILDATVTRRQLIHLHCFTGDKGLVQEWLDTYPNVYFGFTGLARTFDLQQVEALRSVPKDRLLIETDSPYLSWKSAINTPAHIGEVASMIAHKLELSVEEVLSRSLENGRRLYQ